MSAPGVTEPDRPDGTAAGVAGGAPVDCQTSGAVARLTLARPAVLNAIDQQVCQALVRHIERLEQDGETRVIVVSGQGRAFSAGADLRLMRSLDAQALRRFIELTWWAFDRLRRSPLVSIAALHGHVLGGGLELALACDLRIADDTASLALPEMGLGSVPGSGAMQRLPALIGESRTLELALSGRRVQADEALRIGLVNLAVPAGQAQDQAMQWAASFAGRPAEAVRYAKTAMRARGDPELAAALHGLISACCQKNKAYQGNTERFQA